ncbi:MAG: bifunctional 23S rRNA (guanine(2069)-N(7))-methyltransferase RlmK/23S rRNA (guanine(2445)-N(2))-methyltransferase RlmL [Pseudomonadales bacterium]|nr:bifunctional 23S rRNA (guanine(2069)-N(7))-methyltransferase RlmK/23S rRNA (guanine(2445)-N(2))-methyltransferase RlmL [Pseudomonadales bacterium]
MTTTYFATAPLGMTDLLEQEINQLGASACQASRAGVSFDGDIETAYRVCLWSRIANRVLLPLASFAADTPEALYDGVKAIDWQAHLSSRETLAVDANISSSAMTHTQYAALRVKDAIVDQFSERFGKRPNVDVNAPDVRINCYIHKDEATIYLDLSGNSLHQRNYRLAIGQAPLKENLAAAILLRARWPEISGHGGALVDPMCGSGTLLIEGLMMAADIAPGLDRTYWGFSGWKGHKPAIWERLLAEANYRRTRGLENIPLICGSDADERVVGLARENAERAGLADYIHFTVQDVHHYQPEAAGLTPESTGLIVTNPPYGRRLAETGELPAIYAALGATLKRCFVGWQVSVFTEDQKLGHHLGMRSQKVNSLYNGAIPCKLMHYLVDEKNYYRYERLPKRLAADALSEQAQGFRNRLQKNLKQLRKWARQEDVTNYRVYDADLPDYSAAVDVYSDVVVSDLYWVVIQEYEAPATIDPQKARTRTFELVTVVQEIFGVPDERLFYKQRTRQRGDAQYEKLSEERHFHIVREGVCKLWVNFEDYLDTGLFLDHRPVRSRIGQEAAGKDFLNLFAYTGAATVQAAMGGARSTTTVDMSKTYLAWAQRNLALNNLPDNGHQLVQADCIEWVRLQAQQSYDLIFLDPPTFSNSKRMKQNFDVQRDHVALVSATLRLLRPGGTLYFSNNQRNFRLDGQLAEQTGAVNLSRESVPFDFRRRQNIHHLWQFIKKA